MSDLGSNHSDIGFVSSKTAAEAYGVTNDYIARLCRGGKLRGVLEGRAWLVETRSLQEFFGRVMVVGPASNANTSLRRGVWEHVVVVRSGGTTFYYLNGAADGSGDVVSPASNVGDDLTFGTDDLASYIKESLDDVRMYNRALSAAEAKQLYNLGVQKIAASSQTLTGGSSLTNGLVGHWTMDGPDVTDKVYDRSGNSNNGYYYAGATSSAKKIGKMGQALNFSGSQSIEVSDHATLDINGNGTIAAWIKRSQTGTWDAVLAKGDTDVDADNNYNLEISNTDGVTCTIGNGAGGATILHSGGSVDTNWHHVACVWNGSTIRTYLDGVELGFDTQTVTPAGNAAFLGIGEWGVGGDFMDGLLDDVRLYNRALTPSEIKQLYNLGK